MYIDSMKCPNCGATMQMSDDYRFCKCPYCNSSFKVEVKTLTKEELEYEKIQLKKQQTRIDYEKSKMKHDSADTAGAVVCFAVLCVCLAAIAFLIL